MQSLALSFISLEFDSKMGFFSSLQLLNNILGHYFYLLLSQLTLTYDSFRQMMITDILQFNTVYYVCYLKGDSFVLPFFSEKFLRVCSRFLLDLFCFFLIGPFFSYSWSVFCCCFKPDTSFKYFICQLSHFLSTNCLGSYSNIWTKEKFSGENNKS